MRATRHTAVATAAPPRPTLDVRPNGLARVGDYGVGIGQAVGTGQSSDSVLLRQLVGDMAVILRRILCPHIGLL